LRRRVGFEGGFLLPAARLADGVVDPATGAGAGRVDADAVIAVEHPGAGGVAELVTVALERHI
jgi:hypothetical protein